MQRRIKISLGFRLWPGIVVSLAITLITVLTIGKHVSFKVLLLIGLSRFIYCLAIWLLYQACARLALRYRIFNFLLYLAISILLILPVIAFNIWINRLFDIFYPPFVTDPSSVKNQWDYYSYFYLLRAIAMSVTVYAIQYREDLVEEKQAMRLANEKLAQQNLIVQLEALRQQINPHFLFNTLNSLKVLISSDPRQAENYTVQLANVYRYLLHHRKSDMVTLQEEIEFLKSYLELFKIRFGENLVVAINIDPVHYFHKLLPLSLQVLVENALKHNIISRDKPLHVNIYIEGEKLVVENGIQPRLTTEGSSRYGLYHLSEQFRLQTGKDIDIVKTEDKFSVHLPLITPVAI